jgi:hypothetical protein
MLLYERYKASMHDGIWRIIMEEYKKIIDVLSDKSKEILGDNLIGVYIHGSIAMQCFNWNKSDIDILFVVKKEPCIEVKLQFMNCVVECNKIAPPKGIELSMVLEEACREFVYPTPFVLHFSNGHIDWYQKDPIGYCQNMRGIDNDLAAHFTITKEYGITWWGQEIDKTFGEVPREYYLDSIRYDVNDTVQNISKNPMYTILTLCRVAAYIKAGLILSKEQGGHWGCRNLPEEYSKLANEALECYQSERILNVEPEQVMRFISVLMIIIEEREG